MQCFPLLEPGPTERLQASAPRVVGIDFGTTYSLVAALVDGHIRTLPDERTGQALLPSIVYVGAKKTEVGQAALSRLLTDPSITFRSIKRFLGRSFEEIHRDFPELLHQTRLDTDGSVQFETPRGNIYPVQVAAEVLKRLVERAERHFGDKLTGAVITVPAYFDDAQRKAIQAAARLAKVPILRLLHEPTAAAIAHGMVGQRQQVIAVYDFGGGTFDFTLLQCRDQLFEVLATGGDSQLGGDDIDQQLMGYLIARCQQEAPGSIDAAHPEKYLPVFREQARAAKHALSQRTEVPVQYRHWSMRLTREGLIKLAEPWIDGSFTIVKRVLQTASISVQQIHQVLLIGGGSRLPGIVEQATSFFQQTPVCSIDPERMVAQGAAQHALQLVQAARGSQDGGYTLIDVTPLSLGLETLYGGVEVLIPRNTPLPTSKTQQFTTAVSGQKNILFHVVQGESAVAEACRSLGTFTLKQLPAMPAGVAEISVTFTVDADGILEVVAEETVHQTQNRIAINPSYGLSDRILAALLNTEITQAGSKAISEPEAPWTVEKEALLTEARRTQVFLRQRWLPVESESTVRLDQLLGQLEKAYQRLALAELSQHIEAIKELVLPILWEHL